MDKNQSLQSLLNNTATEEDIELLKRLLASGEISIGGNVNQSVIIIGSGNTVELSPAALDRLNARPMLGNLDRDLTGEEIALGLRRLDKLLPNRAPVLLPHYKEQVGRLRPTLKTEIKSLSESARRERVEALAAINSICVEAVDISFNGLSLGEEAPKYDARSPFRGLESFRAEDSEFFFGREALTEKLVGKIKAHSFLAVLGASGSGKSSLVMAGMIPALDSDYIVFRPGTNPLGELESARGKSLIVVDQFEELFTLTRDESTRKDFIARLLDESTRARIILTLRSDFLGEVGAYRTLSAEIQNHLEIIPPMDMDELRRAMEGQAGVVGLRFEADLSQQILDDVAGEPGAMPLLQHALWELWNRRHGRNLRASEYRAFGGVKQAITSTAEKVYADCSKPEQDALRDIFLRLTRLDEGDEGRDTRRRVPLGDLIPSGRDAASITLLLDKLANARLVVKTVNEDKAEVEVAHEALIRHWERLRIWLNEDRDNLRLRESVSESAKEWENTRKDESLLNHRGGRLDDALSLGKDSRHGLTVNEQAYLNECVRLRNREQHERERRKRITLVSVFAVSVAIMAILVGWSISSTKSANANATQVSINSTQVAVANTAQADAETEKQNAKKQAEIAIARQLGVQAQSIAGTKDLRLQTSILLAVQSLKLFPHSDVFNVLNSSNLTAPVVIMRHEKYITLIAFSPDGRYIISGSGDNTARVWDIYTGREVSRMTHEGIVNSIDFSPDGKYVISTGYHEPIRVWNPMTGEEVTKVDNDSYDVIVKFDPSGKHFVSTDRKGATLWETKTGKKVSRMTPESLIVSLQFSPNGRYLITGSCDNTARVWDVVTGKEIARTTHEGGVNHTCVRSVAFSPDSQHVVSGGDDGTARVWDALTGKEIVLGISESFYGVNAVEFSPDGQYVVSASDETARVWSASTGEEISRISYENIGSVEFADYSPNGRYIISGVCIEKFVPPCDTGTAVIWNATTGEKISEMLHSADINYVAFSPNGNYAVSGDGDGVIKVWLVQDKQEIDRLPNGYFIQSLAFKPDGTELIAGGCKLYENNAICDRGVIENWKISDLLNIGAKIENALISDGNYEGTVDAVAFSPDGRYIAVAVWGDGTVRILNSTTGRQITVMHHPHWVHAIAFSPDSHLIVSGSQDKTASVWEVATGNLLYEFHHDNVVNSVAFSPDGNYVASASADGTAKIWSAINGNEISRMVHDGAVNLVRFSNNGKYIITGSEDGTARVWNSISGKEIARMTHGGKVKSADFSPNDQYVVSGGCDIKNTECNLGTARVWVAMNGQEVARITHTGEVRFVAFSPDNRYVVSGGCEQIGFSTLYCDKGVARVWDLSIDSEIASKSHAGFINVVGFSPDGQYIASGGDGLILWKYRLEDLITESCAKVTRNLNPVEWAQYIGDALPYQAVCPNLPIEPEAAGTPTP